MIFSHKHFRKCSVPFLPGSLPLLSSQSHQWKGGPGWRSWRSQKGPQKRCTAWHLGAWRHWLRLQSVRKTWGNCEPVGVRRSLHLQAVVGLLGLLKEFLREFRLNFGSQWWRLGWGPRKIGISLRKAHHSIPLWVLGSERVTNAWIASIGPWFDLVFGYEIELANWLIVREQASQLAFNVYFLKLVDVHFLDVFDSE